MSNVNLELFFNLLKETPSETRERYINGINWTELLVNHFVYHFNIRFLEEYKRNIKWVEMTIIIIESYDKKLYTNDEFATICEQFKDYLNWNALTEYFCNNFWYPMIEKYIDLMDPEIISTHENVISDNSLLRKIAHRIDWVLCLRNRKFSDDFILEMKEYIFKPESISTLVNENLVSKEIVNKISEALTYI